MRSIETEGVVCQLTLDAFGAALREVLNTLVQGEHAMQAFEDLVEWSCPAWRVFVVSHDEHIGKSCDLSGAFVYRLLDAVFG